VLAMPLLHQGEDFLHLFRQRGALLPGLTA
jgi:hypothetical protein